MRRERERSKQRAAGRGKIRRLKGNDEIEGILITEGIKIQKNPKRLGGAPWRRYEIYQKAKTIQEAMEMGGSREDMRWDIQKGFIKRAKEVTVIKGSTEMEMEETKEKEEKRKGDELEKERERSK